MLPPLQLERYMPDIGIKQVDHMIKSTTTTNPQITTQKAPHTSVNHINSLFLKKDTNGVIKVLPPKTAEEILARERERKAMTTLLMALPEDHLAKFHKMTDAKDMWDAIKSRFGGNDESNKMQKYILKQQFEGFSVSNSEGLHKGYDRFQSLLSRLEIHGVESLNLILKALLDHLLVHIMSPLFLLKALTVTKYEVILSIWVSTSSGYNSQRENSSSYTDELMYSFFANQSSGPHLDHEYLEQLDEFDLEEMDLKWEVAMISMNGKHFARECRLKGNTRYKSKDNGRRPRKQEEPKALVTLDGEGVDWTDHAEDEQENFALMAYSNSGSNTEEKIRFMKIDLDDKTDVLTYHKKLLAEAVKEKEELKTKLENFQSSSKGLSKLLNSQISKRDKSGLGYGDQVHDGVLSYGNEVFQSVFDSRSSDVEDSPVHDRFANVEGMHARPPLQMTEIICPQDL
ncbi:hypothetical protein Tco_1556018 [Tanacetum coccineum]